MSTPAASAQAAAAASSASPTAVARASADCNPDTLSPEGYWIPPQNRAGFAASAAARTASPPAASTRPVSEFPWRPARAAEAAGECEPEEAPEPEGEPHGEPGRDPEGEPHGEPDPEGEPQPDPEIDRTLRRFGLVISFISRPERPLPCDDHPSMRNFRPRALEDLPFTDGEAWRPDGGDDAAGPTTPGYLRTHLVINHERSPDPGSPDADTYVWAFLVYQLGLPRFLLDATLPFSWYVVGGPYRRYRRREWRVFWLRPGDVMRARTVSLVSEGHVGWIAVLPPLSAALPGNDDRRRGVRDAGYLELVTPPRGDGNGGPRTTILRPHPTEATAVAFRKDVQFRYVAPRRGSALLLTSPIILGEQLRNIKGHADAVERAATEAAAANAWEVYDDEQEARDAAMKRDYKAAICRTTNLLRRIEALQRELRLQRSALRLSRSLTQPLALIDGLGVRSPFAVILECRYAAEEFGALCRADLATAAGLRERFPRAGVYPLNVAVTVPKALSPLELPGVLPGDRIKPGFPLRVSHLCQRPDAEAAELLRPLTLYHNVGVYGGRNVVPPASADVRSSSALYEWTVLVVAGVQDLGPVPNRRPWTDRIGQPDPDRNPYRADFFLFGCDDEDEHGRPASEARRAGGTPSEAKVSETSAEEGPVAALGAGSGAAQ